MRNSKTYCFADKPNLSANYFGDLVKQETGKTAIEYLHLKLINVAKARFFDTSKSKNEIAYESGFNYPEHLVVYLKTLQVSHHFNTDPIISLFLKFNTNYPNWQICNFAYLTKRFHNLYRL